MNEPEDFMCYDRWPGPDKEPQIQWAKGTSMNFVPQFGPSDHLSVQEGLMNNIAVRLSKPGDFVVKYDGT